MLKLLPLFLLICTLLYTPILYSQEEAAEGSEESAQEQEPLLYYLISPNIMTFYQSSGKKIGYIVVQVQVVARGQEKIDLLEHNLPLIQDALTDFFNKQDKKTIQDLKLREELRMNAKEVVAEVIKNEVKTDVVENLLFTQYIFQ